MNRGRTGARLWAAACLLALLGPALFAATFIAAVQPFSPPPSQDEFQSSYSEHVMTLSHLDPVVLLPLLGLLSLLVSPVLAALAWRRTGPRRRRPWLTLLWLLTMLPSTAYLLLQLLT